MDFAVLDDILADVRYAFRMLRRQPGLFAVVVLLLGWASALTLPSLALLMLFCYARGLPHATASRAARGK